MRSIARSSAALHTPNPWPVSHRHDVLGRHRGEPGNGDGEHVVQNLELDRSRPALLASPFLDDGSQYVLEVPVGQVQVEAAELVVGLEPGKLAESRHQQDNSPASR